MDYEGAVQCFEKALEVNPQSAAAHFELGWLYDQKQSDPSAAIYHYNCYLKFCPNAGNSDLVKQHVLTCKQELARTVSLGPITEKVQREFEQITQDNKRLTEENKNLHEELEKWTAYAYSLQALTNRAVGLALPSRSIQSTAGGDAFLSTGSPAPSSGGNRLAAANAPAGRTHTVKPGETPTLIARRYGIKLDLLMTANPGLNARRLQVGQALSIPAP
jgi:LysM repeat protein